MYSSALTNHKNLQSRISFSKRHLQEIQQEILKYENCNSQDICIFAAGSLARLETGRISDLDVFLIADRKNRNENESSLSRLTEIMTLSELIQANRALNLKPFSGDGRYLKIPEVRNIMAETGSETDDSENFFTTRLLLLLESKPLANKTLYQESIDRIVKMYFRDGRGRNGYKPLFLLNDILRYWRTLCLNYERSRNEPGKPWWKKNLNLKFPRKLTVFSTVLAIIAQRIDNDETFLSLISMTPLERFAYALDTINDDSFIKQFEEFLNNYEEFLAAKSHSELEVVDEQTSRAFAAKAEQFNELLHSILASPKIDKDLVRYLSI